MSSPEMSQPMREWLYGGDPAPTASTLGWFINRFRNAPPSTRQQRDRVGLPSSRKEEGFWWLSPPSGSSTPLADTPPQKLTPSPRRSPKQTPKKRYSISLSSPSSSDPADGVTSDIQRRAAELLEKSETTIHSTSTEPFQPLPTRKIPGERYKPSPQSEFLPHPRPAKPRPDSNTTQPGPAGRPNPWHNPEDDILYQWRLARKMEQAQERVAASGLSQAHGRTSGTAVKTMGGKRFNVPSTHDRQAPSPSSSVLPDSVVSATPLPDTLGDILASEAASKKVPTTLHIPDTATSIAPSSLSPPMEAPGTLITVPAPSVPENSRIKYVPIATPSANIARPYNHPHPVQATEVHQTQLSSTEVPPHMHLACDIIPCPHHHHHGYQDGHYGNHGMKPCCHGNATRSFKSIDPCRSSGFDNGKLKPEKRIQRLGKENQDNAVSRKRSGKASTEEKQEGLQKPNQFKVTHPLAVHVQENLQTREVIAGRDKGDKGRRRERQQSRGDQDRNTSSDVLGSVISKVVSEHLFSGEEFTSSSDEYIKSSTSHAQESTSTGTAVSHRGQSTHTSSVASHRGQSTKAVASHECQSTSTGTAAPHRGQSTSTARSHGGKGDSKMDSTPHTAEIRAVLVDSTDDEFADDEILRVLKQKSASFREKLRQIDSLLNQGS